MIIERKLSWALVLVCGCAVQACAPNDVTLGAAVKNSNAAQIIEPDPQYAEEQVALGSQVAGAQERYRTDRVKKPAAIRTTEGGAGQSSSSGGSN